MEKTINYENKVLKLAVIRDGNWDLYYCEDDKQLYYIPKKKGCGDGWWGDLYHLQNVERRFGFTYIAITELGKKIGIEKMLKN